MKRVLLLDGDIVAYVIACRFEQDIDWGDGVVSRADEDEVFEYADRYLTSLQESLDGDDSVICLSDVNRHYFRHDIYPGYKAHRTQGEPPKRLDDVKAFLRAKDNCVWYPRLEADDVLGILHTDYREHARRKIETVLVTKDKDLMQIPGLFFRLDMEREIRRITEEEANLFLWTQMLTGDPTDGIPGCKGVGPIRAKKVIDLALDEWDNADSVDADPWDFVWPAIRSAYLKKGHTEEYALTMARLVRILRYGEYRKDTHEVSLWTPPL